MAQRSTEMEYLDESLPEAGVFLEKYDGMGNSGESTEAVIDGTLYDVIVNDGTEQVIVQVGKQDSGIQFSAIQHSGGIWVMAIAVSVVALCLIAVIVWRCRRKNGS